jgi:hypothetical protein
MLIPGLAEDENIIFSKSWKMRTSSRYTNTKSSKKAPSTLFIIRLKVAGALHNPKGMTVYSNCPYLVTMAVFGMSAGLTGTWW